MYLVPEMKTIHFDNIISSNDLIMINAWGVGWVNNWSNYDNGIKK